MLTPSLAALTVLSSAILPPIPTSEPAFPIQATWTMTWDDRTDGVAEDIGKTCRVELDSANGRLAGRFIGEVLGEERDAVFSGEVIGDELIVMRQDEPGYTVTYHARRDGEGYVGTWMDTRGGGGDFRIEHGGVVSSFSR